MLHVQCLQIASTNKHGEDEVIGALRFTSAGNPSQYIANNQKHDRMCIRKTWHISHHTVIRGMMLLK